MSSSSSCRVVSYGCPAEHFDETPKFMTGQCGNDSSSCSANWGRVPIATRSVCVSRELVISTVGIEALSLNISYRRIH